MIDKDLVAEIDFSKSDHYTLSIRLSADGFSFTIFNPIQDNILSFLPLQLDMSLPVAVNIREVMKSEILGHTYRRVNVLQVSNRFTTVPIGFLTAENQYDTFFYYNHKRKANEVVLCNDLGKANLTVAFGIDQSAWMSLTEHYPQARFYSQASPLVEFLADKSRLGNNRKMYVYGRGMALDVFCFERGKLLFANSYALRQADDAAYFLLNVWNCLGYQPERDELHLLGTFADKEKMVGEVRGFVRQIFTLNPKAEFTHAGLTCIEQVPFDLQALCLCEI